MEASFSYFSSLIQMITPAPECPFRTENIRKERLRRHLGLLQISPSLFVREFGRRIWRGPPLAQIPKCLFVPKTTKKERKEERTIISIILSSTFENSAAGRNYTIGG
jgi:hypothetical protein